MFKSLSLTVLIAGLMLALPATSAENPFALKDLGNLPQIASSHGDGKCGGEKKDEAASKCGGEKKDEAASKCGGEKKDEAASKCGGEKKEPAMQCGSGKCGGSK